MIDWLIYESVAKKLLESGYDVHYLDIANDDTLCPYIQMYYLQNKEDLHKSGASGVISMDIGVWHDRIDKRKELMEIMNHIFETSRMIQIDGYELMVNERSSRILLDTSTSTQYLHGVVELEIKYTGG